MGWTPRQRRQCAKVAVVENSDDRRGVHGKGYHHRARFGEETISGAWSAPGWLGGVSQENIAGQAVVIIRGAPESVCPRLHVQHVVLYGFFQVLPYFRLGYARGAARLLYRLHAVNMSKEPDPWLQFGVE
jgi:hypothetical protein